jgi:lon-related putative ATP-dependent protease
VREAVARIAASRPVPPDWVYVHNFDEPDRPRAIALPPGEGKQLAARMETLLQTIARELPRALESEEIQRRRDAIMNAVAERRSELLDQLERFARAREIGLEVTPAGIMSFPLRNGEPLPKEVYDQLPELERREIERRGQEVQEQIAATLRTIAQLEREAAEALHQLEHDVVRFVTWHLFEDLRERYRAEKDVLAFLDRVETDLPEHAHDFLPTAPAAGAPPVAEFQLLQRSDHISRYTVNVLIDNSGLQGAPVVFERNPTFANLIGRIDYRPVFGAMVTDFRQIRPGALHRANGGFLVLHVLEVLRNPYSWEALKRALLCREVEIENLAEQLSVLPTVRLRPEPIPLDVKVVLIGPAFLYQLLYQADEDFAELFGVRADFAPDITWNDEHVHDYAAFISRQVWERQLRHFDRNAVARVVEYGARLRDDQRKLSARFLDIASLITEASHWATKSGHDPVMAEDVEKAIAKRAYRANLPEERIQELIRDQIIAIETQGERVGQVNGLSIIDLGDYQFGIPARITARVAIGRGSIVSIEREIELSGPIHSKGFLILAGYLQGQYGAEMPLALTATITFEQSYTEVEGDSAASTELYALISALSGVPLRQGIAVTGSVNQHGEIQAVGGVTRKIEGFFAACQMRGLTGDQGVIIPAANIQSLMLNDDVIQAVTEGKFHIWAIRHVDEGIELLTGRPAGTRGPDGKYPPDSVHGLVQARLAAFLKQARVLAAPEPAGANGRTHKRASALSRSLGRRSGVVDGGVRQQAPLPDTATGGGGPGSEAAMTPDQPSAPAAAGGPSAAHHYDYFAHDADVGIIGYGATLEEAFIAAAEAVFAQMVDPSQVKLQRVVRVEFEEDDPELALVTWLNLLLAEAKAQGLALASFELTRRDGRWYGVGWGEPWREGLEPGVEVKGATLTMLSVRQTERGWEARCVVDV